MFDEVGRCGCSGGGVNVCFLVWRWVAVDVVAVR